MLPRYSIIDGFLGETAAGDLLELALASEHAAEPAAVTAKSGYAVDPSHRSAFSLAFGFEGSAFFREAIMRRLGEIFESIGIRAFENPVLELEFVAHRDGGKFAEHVDTMTDSGREDSDRIVSAVYYFHREPRGFTGGQLAICGIGSEERVEIEPVHDRLAIFPSFAPHEVTPVSVPGNAFADARFSINCWIRRPRA